MLLKDQAEAFTSAEQRPLTIIMSISLPGGIQAIESIDIDCYAYSADRTRFIAADSHGFLHFGHIPRKTATDSLKQITFDFGPVDFLDSFARSMSWVYEDVYAGPSVMSHMQHYNGYRQWHSVALVESPHTFAAMDSKGIVEIWRYEGCGWKQERVRQRCRVAPYPNGQSSLEWHPSGSYLSMTDNYGKQYRFIRKGWLRKRWQQVPIRTV